MIGQAINAIDKLSRPVIQWFNKGAQVTLALMMFLTVSDVILRYVFRMPLSWSYELTEVFLLVIVFLGFAYLGVKKGNVAVTVVTSHLPEKAQNILGFVTSLISLILLVFITWQGALQAKIFIGVGQVTSNLSIPYAVPLSILVIGSFMYGIVLFRDLLVNLQEILKGSQVQAWLSIIFGFAVGIAIAVSLYWYPLLNLDLTSANWSVVGIIILLVMMLLGLPIAFSMMLAGVIGGGCMTGTAAGMDLLRTVPYSTSMKYTFSVIPLFVLMGQFAYQSGIIKDLYYSVSKWVGHLPGGLAIATIGGCAGFAAVSGSSVASAAAMGTICYPELKRYNYDPKLATGCIAAGGTLGIMIPPSLDFIIYGVLTMTSIGSLFIAGIFPGLLMTFMFMITAYLISIKNPKMGPLGPKSTMKEKIFGLKGVWPILVLFAVVIGGIYMGMFTPTEAGGIGAFGSFLFVLGKRKLTWKGFFDSLAGSVETTAMIFIITIGAFVLGYFITITQIPMRLADFLGALAVSRWVIIAAIMVLYLIMGCIMDALSAMIVTVPILFPVVMALGFDPIWYGVLMIVVVELGLITPPVGLIAFVIQGVTKDVSLGTIFKGILPFLIMDLVAVGLIIAFPQISTYLPTLMGG